MLEDLLELFSAFFTALAYDIILEELLPFSTISVVMGCTNPTFREVKNMYNVVVSSKNVL